MTPAAAARLRAMGVLPALAALAACGPAPTSAPSSSPTGSVPPAAAGPATAAPSSAAPAPSADPSCGDLVARMTPEERAGQLFMVGRSANEPVDAEFRSMLAQTRTGQVLLLENTTAGRAGVRRLVDDVRSAASAPQGVRLLVAADQEGGRVQRLTGEGFAPIPSAVEQARRDDAALARDAERWGADLKRAGIDVNLAPVTDVVPAQVGDANDPIGALDRGYGDTPGEVVPKANAFIRGMDAAGVATSVKHFPNLGRVRGNTDHTGGVADAVTTRDDAALEPFRAGIAAGGDMVMVSTAVYRRIHPDTPATFSRVVIDEMIRDDLDFDGVVISDDLGAAQQVASVAPGDRAVRFVDAGGDVVINGDPALQRAMVGAVRERAARDAAFEARVRDSAQRVVALKARHGAAACTP